MEIWKTLRVSHIPTPPATTANYFLTKRYTNIPLGTKDRSGHNLARIRARQPPMFSRRNIARAPSETAAKTMNLRRRPWPDIFLPLLRFRFAFRLHRSHQPHAQMIQRCRGFTAKRKAKKRSCPRAREHAHADVG